MPGYCISPQAETQLDGIWLYIAKGSGNTDTASRIVQGIVDRFLLLAQHPRMGRRRTDLASDLRSHAAGDYVILYSIETEDMVFIHQVLHGSRDIEGLFGWSSAPR